MACPPHPTRLATPRAAAPNCRRRRAAPNAYLTGCSPHLLHRFRSLALLALVGGVAAIPAAVHRRKLADYSIGTQMCEAATTGSGLPTPSVKTIPEIQSSHHIPGGSPTSARLAWAACLHDEVTNNGADSHIWASDLVEQYVEIRNVVVTSVLGKKDATSNHWLTVQAPGLTEYAGIEVFDKNSFESCAPPAPARARARARARPTPYPPFPSPFTGTRSAT